MWKCTECQHENPDTVATCEECEASRDASTFIGMQISHWILEGQLGEGGMAIVFLARHAMLKSPVAIKLLRADLTHKRDVIERFRTEALAASQLQHENVIQVLDFGHQKGIGFYMVLEFLEGRDLEEYIGDHIGMQIPISWSIGVAKQICAGLQVAHNAGIIHRDLKPSNIYLVPRPDSKIPLVKVLDFGIAKIQESEREEGSQKLTRTGTVLGTPFYLAPEQLTRRSSDDLTSAVDIYALGVIFFQLLSGQLPIEEPSVAEQMVAILTKKPPRVGEIREELSGTAIEIFLMRMLAKDPQHRPATVDEAWLEFERAASVLIDEDSKGDEALRLHWESTYQPLLEEGEKPFLERWKWPLSFALLLLLSGAGWLIYMATRPPQTRVIVQVKKEKLPELPRLQAEGIKAFNSKDYSKAIAVWRKMTRSQQWNKKSKYFNPLIYKSLGVALIRKNYLHSAVREYRKFIKNAVLKPEEKSKFESFLSNLEKELAKRRLASQRLQKNLGVLLKRNKYAEARKNYETFFDLKNPNNPKFKPDPSLPDAYIGAGEALEKQFPSQAIRLYKKALKLDLRKGAKGALRRKISRLQQTNRAQIQQGLNTLNQQIDDKQTNKAKKTLTKLLEQHHDQADLYTDIKKTLRSKLLKRPKTSKRLLSLFRKKLQKLRKDHAWSWLKPSIGKSLPSDKELEELGRSSNELKGALANTEKVKKALKKGQLERALKRLEPLSKKWDELKATNSPWRDLVKKNANETKSWLERLKQAIPLWKKAKTLHKEERLSELRPTVEEFIKLIKESGAENDFQNRFIKWEKKHLKARRYLSQASRFYKERRWLRAEKRYIWYVKMFPRSLRKKDVIKQIDDCQCRRNVPWKTCPKKY